MVRCTSFALSFYSNFLNLPSLLMPTLLKTVLPAQPP